jgi:hypothetical protein
MKNEDLSVSRFIINKFIYCIAQILKGAIYLDKSRIFIMLGIITAFLKSLRNLSKFSTVDEIKFEIIDSLYF